ncbi:MAG: hypothetical protein JO141_34015 [Bradyrhizobium sp.]|nr:hypothetical protein [Bradyrhizobium sp.]
MNWAWATSLDHIWRSPGFPMWLTLAAAGFFGLIVLITLLRAEKSVANGALTVITLLAVGIAVASTLRGSPIAMHGAAESPPAQLTAARSLPALACIDDIAGEAVEQACEKVLFGSAESTAAAVNHMAAMVTRLTSLGDAATAQRSMTAETQALRRAIEHDRYGLVAQVLLARDRCTPTECSAYRALTDNHQIITNMDEHTFDALVARYAPSWNMPSVPTALPAPSSMLGASVPTGRPTNAEFPSAANTPPVSIMTPEPGTGTAAARAAASAADKANAAIPPRPSTQTGAAPSASLAPSPPPEASKEAAKGKKTAAKKPPAAPASAPVQISPGAQPPAESND